MKKDALLYLIHEIQHGRAGRFPMTVAMVATSVDCSKSYAIRWLNHYADSGIIGRVRVAYKNTVKDYFCQTSDVERQIEFIENFMNETVLETQENGEWIQCLTTLNP